MSFETSLTQARNALLHSQNLLHIEIRDYPTPISGCDAQYNYLIGQRTSISHALSLLEGPSFVATPRTPAPGCGIESR